MDVLYEETVGKSILKALALEFGISYIEQEDTLTIIGERQHLVFKKYENAIYTYLEETQCQLIEIY